MAFKPSQSGEPVPGDKASVTALFRSKFEKEQADKGAGIEKSLTVLEEERVYREGVVSVRDIIAPAAFKVDPSMVHIGDLVARTIYVITYPRFISLGWFSPIMNMGMTADIAMYFYPVKASVILKQLKKKVGTVQAELSASAEKGSARDPAAETALRDIENLRDSLTQGTEHFFQFALYVTVYAKNQEELEKLSSDLEALLGSKLVYSKKVFYQ